MGKTVKLAFSYLKYYKKQTAALLIGIVMSAALITGIGSLLYSGETANLERARSLYGDWHYQFRMDDGKLDDYSSHMEEKGYKIERAGILTVKKVVETPYPLTLVYGDETYMDMMGRKLLSGHYPEKPGEIALDSRTIRNLDLSGKIGSQVEISGSRYLLCGLVEQATHENLQGTPDDMKVFVSPDTALDKDRRLLYIKFDETKDLLPQLKAMTSYFGYDIRNCARNNEVIGYLGGYASEAVTSIIKTGLMLPDGKLTFIWGQLNNSFNLTSKLIFLSLCLFGAFVIYSLFQISVRKRTAQYSVMQVLGMDEKLTFAALCTELCLIFLVGYPLGAAAGNLTAKILYSHIGKIFVNQNIGTIQAGVHAENPSQIIGEIATTAGEFHVSASTLINGAAFLLLLLILISWLLVRRMHRFTWIEMISQNTGSRNRDGKIYSQKTDNLTGVLTKKFMFERKGTFLGIVISLSIGGIIFLGTTYVTQNTKQHNELAFKADDGLGSDIQVYEDSDTLSDVIPEAAVQELEKIPGVASVAPVSYTLGELPLTDGIFRWPTYYPETANQEGFEQDPEILDKYNGIITQQSENDYRLKANVYGYSDNMLAELSDYLLEGTIDPQMLKKDNTVILKTIMDGQGNYNGIDLQPGDSIRLKVPVSLDVPAEALRFQGQENWYQEKEFKIAAIVSRSLGKTDYYIGDSTSSQPGIIMTNDQMKSNFGISGYNSAGLQLSKGADSQKAADTARRITSEIPNCLLKSYTDIIEQQNLFLKQKMFFFYGIAVILLLISLLHILNSMQYIITSRKHEFGILRAMGITDSGFCRMLLVEGIRYGITSGIVMITLYLIIQKVLYYAMVHVFLYLHPTPGIDMLPVAFMAALNMLICLGAVLYGGREVLQENIIDEIQR